MSTGVGLPRTRRFQRFLRVQGLEERRSGSGAPVNYLPSLGRFTGAAGGVCALRSGGPPRGGPRRLSRGAPEGRDCVRSPACASDPWWSCWRPLYGALGASRSVSLHAAAAQGKWNWPLQLCSERKAPRLGANRPTVARHCRRGACVYSPRPAGWNPRGRRCRAGPRGLRPGCGPPPPPRVPTWSPLCACPGPRLFL